MADVTVLGAGGATVTIALSSAQVSTAAQFAVNKVNSLTALDLVDVQTQTGAGTLPALTNSLGAVVFNGTGFSGLTGDSYRLIAATGTGANAVLSGRNPATTVVVGDNANLTYANVSSNADVFIGKNNSAIVNFEGKVTASTADGTHLIASAIGTKTTVNVGVGGTLNIRDVGGLGLGATTVNALGSSTINAFATSATLPGLVNMTLKSGNVAIGLGAIPGGSGGASAIINPGAANVTIVGNVAASATLFGGTGSVAVDGVMGNFTGGSAGGNLMRTSTVSGSTTLTGGGTVGTPGDALNAQGANQTLNAGVGNTTLAAVTANGATGGSTFNVGIGISTVFGFEGGGNTVNFGDTGTSQVLGRNGATTGSANLYNDVGSGGQFTIHDFTTGLDTLSVKNAFSITFFALTDPANATGSEVTLLQVVGGGSYTFFDATPDGVQNIFNTDVKTV